MNLNLDLLPHQAEFLEDTTTRNLALVGGYGAGKTEALAYKLIVLSLQNAGLQGIALSPTYGMSHKVLIPKLEEILDAQKIKYRYAKSEMVFYIECGRGQTTKLHILAAESYKRAAGINAAFFGIDEADLIAPDLARAAWQMLSSRLRKGNVYQGVAVSTPEGFNFLYEFFKKEVEENPDLASKRRLIKAKTVDNPYLPQEYIDELRSQYPPALLQAYLEGEFVNMNSGAVYPDYDPELNHTGLTVASLPEDVRALHIGMDFNGVSPKHKHGIATVVCVITNGQPHAIDEILGFSKTPDVVAEIKKRYPGRPIYVYPDASASGERTSAAISDRTMLKNAGFVDSSPYGNPRIRDRVNALNAQLMNGAGHRRLLVNRNTCPVLSACLVQQPYDKFTGEPQKDTGFDDMNDALGYFINVRWPVKKSTVTQQSLTV